jgi:LuxR family maltose regulon positive regulatory protein
MEQDVRKYSRYSPPVILPNIAPREALFRLFDKAAARRIVCVTAPAGYGKTTSVALWLEHTRKNAAWIAVSPYDNTLSVFYRRFLSALRDLYPDNNVLREVAGAGIEGLWSASPVEHALEALLSLSNETRANETGAEAETNRTLVIDDAHLIDNYEIVRSLPFVVNALPDGVTTLFLSRGGPAADRLREALTEKPAEVGEESLRFSPEDVLLCFASHGREISDDAARGVWSATEGWPIVVALEAARDVGGEKPAIRMGGETGKNASAGFGLEKYLETEVWGSAVDDEAKKFLSAVCVADEMTPELCARLSGRSDDEAGNTLNTLNTLKTLEKIAKDFSGLVRRVGGSPNGENLNGENRFAVHHLFLDFLRRRLDDAEKARLNAVAAEYYLERQEGYAAVACAVRSGKSDLVTRAVRVSLRYDAATNSIEEHVEKIRTRVIDLMPESMYRELPYLRFLRVWYYHLTGDAAKMLDALDSLYKVMDEIEARFPDFFFGSILMRGFDTRIPTGQILVGKVSEDVMARLDGTTGVFPTRSKNLPFAHKGSKDLSGLPGLPDDPSYFRKTISIWGNSAESYEAVVRAGLWYERNELERALCLARTGEARMAASSPPETVFCTKMITAAILDAMERPRDATARREALRTTLRDADALFLLPNLAAYEAKMRMTAGDVQCAGRWLENYFVDASEDSRLELFRIFQHLTTARALMVRREFHEAKNFLVRVIKLASDFGRIIDRFEAMTLLSVLEWHRGDRGSAAAVLENAIDGARVYRYIRVFADEGASLLPILKRLIESGRAGPVREYQETRARFLKEIYIAAYARSRKRPGVASVFSPPSIRVTKRQKLILQYLSRGYERKGIAAEMGVSQETVKFHTAQTYKKLSVHSAEEAVYKARELGLL